MALQILDLVSQAKAAGYQVETVGRSYWLVSSPASAGMVITVRISQESGFAHRVHLGQVVAGSLCATDVRRLLNL